MTRRVLYNTMYIGTCYSPRWECLHPSYLLGQPREQVPASQEVEDEVQLALRLEGVVKAHHEGVAHLSQDIALHLGAHAVPH